MQEGCSLYLWDEKQVSSRQSTWKPASPTSQGSVQSVCWRTHSRNKSGSTRTGARLHMPSSLSMSRAPTRLHRTRDQDTGSGGEGRGNMRPRPGAVAHVPGGLSTQH